MSRPPSVLPTSAVVGPHLEAVAAVLLEGIALQPGDPAHLIRLRVGAGDLRPGEAEIGILALDGVVDPLDGLVGLVAPDDWAAVGLLATGRATHLTEATSPFPVATASLVARGGAWASAWRPLQGGEGDAGSTSGDGTPTDDLPWGRLDDALRRVLGLATAPPPRSTHRLWATQWLDAIVEAVASDGGRRSPMTPHRVIGLHPAVAAFGLDPAGLTVAGLIGQVAKLTEWRDWPQLRRACAAGLWSQPGIDADTAAWLDDGAFARLALGGWPDLADLHDAIGVLLDPSARTVVSRVLEAAGSDGMEPLENDGHDQ